MRHVRRWVTTWLAAILAAFTVIGCASSEARAEPGPWHHDIVATNFWVGQVIDPTTHDGSQRESAYDEFWMAHYGGCDGIVDADGVCQFEQRDAHNDYFPKNMTPLQNPFYFDVPLVDATIFKRWAEISNNGVTCYGQNMDAGPAVYDDVDYVLGTARPKSPRFYGAGMDVSPALHACLGFEGGVMGASDTVDWRWVDRADVPEGPWTRVIS